MLLDFLPAHSEKLPCRLSIEFVGLEYIIYHNSYAYDHLAELIFGAAGIVTVWLIVFVIWLSFLGCAPARE